MYSYNKENSIESQYCRSVLDKKNYVKREYVYDNIPDCFKFPHVSSKYFKTIVNIGEDIIIPLYITDYHQKEYLYNDNSETFTLYYKVDSEELMSIENIPAGDYDLCIPGRNVENDCEIELYVKDKKGIQSPILYKHIWVRDENAHIITEEQTYTITQTDLDKYGIKNTDSNDVTDMTNTMNGLTSLFQEIKDNGYRKAILLNGIYRIPYNGRTTSIEIPTQFTVDMNGSTFKQNPPTIDEYNEDKGSIICRMTNCYDSHLMNGVLDGDYIERLEVNGELGKDMITGEKGEGVAAFHFVEKCEYCSFENMEVNNITSYALSCKGNVEYYHKTLKSSEDAEEYWLENTMIDNKTGQLITTNKCVTSDYYDISDCIQYSYLIFGVFMGFGGMVGRNSWKYMIFWYDENKNYLGYSNGIQYRPMKFPSDVKYVRLSIIGTNYTPDFFSDMLYYYDYSRNCRFENITANNCRSCVFNPDYYKDLLMKDINITDSGQSITPVPIDFEDGWQNGQDCYMINVNATAPSKGSNEAIFCSGFNYVMDNCDLGILVRSGVYGISMLNTSVENVSRCYFDESGWQASGYRRIQNVQFTNTTISTNNTIDSKCPMMIKDCVLTDCNIELNSLLNCTITNSSDGYSDSQFYNCNIDGFTTTNVTKAKFINCTIKNMTANSSTGIFYKCSLIDSTLRISNTSLVIQKCDLSNFYMTIPSHITPTSILIGNNTIIGTQPLITIDSITANTLFEFVNNNISLTGSNILYCTYTFGGANILFKKNIIDVDSNKAFIDVDSDWHMPTGEVIIRDINNVIEEGNLVGSILSKSSYVNIITEN